VEDFTIDILLPVHGDAKYLANTLESLATELDEKTRLIIIFDRAELCATEIATSFSQKLAPLVQLITSDQPGVAQALNQGLNASSAYLIARIDSDDICIEGRFRRQGDHFRVNSNLVLLGSQALFIDEDGNYIQPYVSANPSLDKDIRKHLKFRNPIIHPSVMYRKDAALTAGKYDPSFEGVEDFELWSRMKKVGLIQNADRPEIFYRISQNQISRKILDQDSKVVKIIAESSQPLTHVKLNYMKVISQIENERNTKSIRGILKLISLMVKLLMVNPKILYSYTRYRCKSHLASLKFKKGNTID
jgi:glycosyltransferase involved in cell wall biosynthesis